ncbi:tetraacyldisaccharide 4'-kinase [Fulvivirga sedimenti]|uniref:Tetraacyldisaccharide 4'-kinase n=1 Tax=Fulvivirga sedimenti TaxID=2879465 RepID=A0A9X1HK61_9BACT|nr:tetraacyldisaccharide 4'-kinase [Fulvivirga sedimenti]MCA6073296.1 tetraacyldisaccharide 4'-kinase [Fulvivirga sedimenti]
MKFFQVLLLPFAWLYDLATRMRNYLYDSGYKTSFEFDRSVISVGNLSAGGTGKTPMVEYLIRLLQSTEKVVTLSRGYGRKTSGFRIAGSSDTAVTIGDEPMQYYSKFNVPVTVGEERAVAIPFILAEFPDTGVILLDDAFQHRPVKPQLNILLTSYQKPFFDDYVLPAGRLRESRRGAARADVIVVTKCPDDISSIRKGEMERAIHRYAPKVPVFYSRIKYGEPTGLRNPLKEVVVVTGIANPELFIRHVQERYDVVEIFRYKDHHQFRENDIKRILERAINGNADIITTEKDYMRLDNSLRGLIGEQTGLFYIPIETTFLENGREFDKMVVDAVQLHASEG